MSTRQMYRHKLMVHPSVRQVYREKLAVHMSVRRVYRPNVSVHMSVRRVYRPNVSVHMSVRRVYRQCVDLGVLCRLSEICFKMVYIFRNVVSICVTLYQFTSPRHVHTRRGAPRVASFSVCAPVRPAIEDTARKAPAQVRRRGVDSTGPPCYPRRE